MSKTYNILLCDDHELIITGLKEVLESVSFIEKISFAKNGKLALDILQKEEFDILISDVSMPDMDGIALSEIVKKDFPKLKLIMLTQFTDMQIFKPLLKNNVDGILLKGGKNSEIIHAIEKVNSGEKYYSNTIMHIIADCYSGDNSATEILVKLSKREQQVLGLIAEEKTNREISEILFISVPTVETYRRNLFRKFEVRNSVGLIRMAMRLGFVS